MRNVEKSIKKATEYLNKHKKRDLVVGEIDNLYKVTMNNNERELFHFIVNAWLFGFSCGMNAQKDN